MGCIKMLTGVILMEYSPGYTLLLGHKTILNKCKKIEIIQRIFFKFIFNYSWPVILYSFQVYNIGIHHLYTLWSDHHRKSSNQLSQYIVIVVILTISPMLYITGSLYFLIPFSFFPITMEWIDNEQKLENHRYVKI